MGGALRLRAIKASLCARAPRAEARALPFGAGNDRQRQADPRIARHRHSACRPPLLPSCWLGLADRQRVCGNQAGRRLRADHPVELSAVDARLEDRAGARGRQHGGVEAGGIYALDRARLRRDLRRSGAASRGRQHRHRRRRDRRGARRPCRRGQDRLHRLDRGRPRDSQGDCRHGQEAVARARGQVAVRRVRGRRPGQRGRGRRRRDLVQPGAGLLRRLAAPGRRERRRGAVRQAARPDGQPESRRSARQVDRRRRDRRAGSARADQTTDARGRAGGARVLSRRRVAPCARLLLSADARHRSRARVGPRARGNLRPRSGRHHLPHAGRSGRPRQQHSLRPRGFRLDRERQSRARGRGAHQGRGRLDQFDQHVRRRLGLWRLSRKRVRARGRARGTARVPHRRRAEDKAELGQAGAPQRRARASPRSGGRGLGARPDCQALYRRQAGAPRLRL